MELQVLQQSIPVVEFNKEELKVFLEQQLEKYKNLVVTPENRVREIRNFNRNVPQGD